MYACILDKTRFEYLMMVLYINFKEKILSSFLRMFKEKLWYLNGFFFLIFCYKASILNSTDMQKRKRGQKKGKFLKKAYLDIIAMYDFRILHKFSLLSSNSFSRYIPSQLHFTSKMNNWIRFSINLEFTKLIHRQ